MTTLGKWVRWEPIKNLASRYCIVSITNDIKELEILLVDTKDDRNKIRVFFKNSVYAHKRTDESFWMNGIVALDEQYGEEFYATWTFFKVYNSEYLTSLTRNLTDDIKQELLLQFSLITYNYFLDIVANAEPLVEFIT